MNTIKLTLSVDEAYLGRYAEVVENCRRAGMLVERQMVSLGIIVGSIDVSKMQDVHKVAGVRDIEPERINRCLE